jgi:hypothetical protein
MILDPDHYVEDTSPRRRSAPALAAHADGRSNTGWRDCITFERWRRDRDSS